MRCQWLLQSCSIPHKPQRPWLENKWQAGLGGQGHWQLIPILTPHSWTRPWGSPLTQCDLPHLTQGVKKNLHPTPLRHNPPSPQPSKEKQGEKVFVA